MPIVDWLRGRYGVLRANAILRTVANGLQRAPMVWHVLLLLTIAYLFYQQVLVKPYLSYSNIPFPILEKPIRGQPLTLEVIRCNDSKVRRNYTTTREIINLATNATVLMGSTFVTINPGCERIVSKITIIPPDLPAGKYRAQGAVEFYDSANSRFIEWHSMDFVLD